MQGAVQIGQFTMYRNVVFLTLLALPLLGQGARGYAEDDSVALLQAAEDAYSRNEAEKAVAAWTAAAEKLSKSGDAVGLAKAYAGLGAAYLKLSDCTRAEKFFALADDLYTRGGDASGHASCLTGLAEAAFQQGDFDKSASIRKESLAVRDQTGDSLGKAVDLVGLAQVYSKRGMRREAVNTYTEALKIFLSANSNEGVASAVSGIGIEYNRLGAYDMALECHTESQQIHKAAGNDFQAARDLANLGNVFEAVADYPEALDHYRKAFHIQERIKDEAGSATSLLNMGISNKNLGNYAHSLRQLREALEKFQAVGNRSGTADAYSNLGVLYKNIGAIKKAETYHLRALQSHQDLNDSTGWASDLANLGVICALRKDHGQALRHFDQARKIFDKTHDRKQAAIAVFNAAAVLVEQGKLKEAAERLDAAAADFESLNYAEGLGWCKLVRGEIEKRQGKLKGAQIFFKQALEICGRTEMPELSCQCRGALAGTLAEEGNTQEAIVLYAATVDQLEKLRRNVGTFQLASAFLAKSSDVYHSVVNLLAERAKDEPTTGALAYRYLEMGRARSFIDMLVESGIDVRKGADPDLLRQEKFLLARISSISNTILTELRTGAPPERIQALREKLQTTETDYHRLQIELKDKCPEYARLYYPEPLTAEQVQQTLEPDAVMLEYSVGKEQCFLFALTRGELQVYPLPAEAEIRQATEKFRELVLSRDSRDYCALASQLYEMLVSPADGLLAGKKNIIVIPDGPLHYLAFECLLTERVSRPDFSRLPYLLRKAAVTYAPSATALTEIGRRQKQQAPNDKQMLICADPDYGTDEDEVHQTMRHARSLRNSLVRLPYSALEARNLSSIFKPGEVLVLDRASASEERLKTMNLSAFRYVNFATHAFLDEECPQFSSIVLAQGNGAEDGFLQTQEIFNLKLNARLVTLSACSTACGELLNGEGVVGLSRAFFYAGTPSVVASLWNVNDASTAKLMTELFTAIKSRGRTPAEALREAKLRIIDAASPASFSVVPAKQTPGQLDTGGSYAHPFYWAAFVLIGK